MSSDLLWYKDAVFYELHVRAFHDGNADGKGDLRGLTQKLDYLQTLGVDCVWLLPIYPSPLRDDGYDIADYYNIHPDYGTLEDFKALVQAVHARGMRLITDLVLNHTSDQHAWFQAARTDRNSPYRDYYVWSDTDDKYAGVRIIFSDVEKSNWSWDEQASQYYWHRFYASQPDLNYDNPAVQEEMLNVVRFWLKLGVDGFRVDAPTYLFEREGTNCESLPETHAYLKRMRQMINSEFPGRVMLAETNQWPRELREYFGEADEFQMAFHFPLMPRLFLSLARENVTPIVEILNATPEIPASCQWAIFARNHDELSLEMVTDEERRFLWQTYAPDPRMILNLGIRRRLLPLMEGHRGKLNVLNSLLFTLPGSPVLYYGDEIGLGENLSLPDRNGVRTPMQWDATPNAGFSDAEPFAPFPGAAYAPAHVNAAAQVEDTNSMFHALRRMMLVRKRHRVFGRGGLRWLEKTNNPAVAAYLRYASDESLLILNNLSSQAQKINLNNGFRGPARDLLTGRLYHLASVFTLEPYQTLWLNAED